MILVPPSRVPNHIAQSLPEVAAARAREDDVHLTFDWARRPVWEFHDVVIYEADTPEDEAEGEEEGNADDEVEGEEETPCS
jgi:hypothetical protein